MPNPEALAEEYSYSTTANGAEEGGLMGCADGDETDGQITP